MRLFIVACVGLVALIAIAPRPSEGVSIYNYSPARHDRFSPGTYPSAPVPNPTFFGRDYDWSGVGWDYFSRGRSFALVSTRHILCANHWRPTRDEVRFRDRSGTVRTYDVSSYQLFGTDMCLATLSTDVVSNIQRYPVLEYGTAAEYVGQTLWVYGRTAAVGRNLCDEAYYESPGEFMLFKYDRSDGHQFNPDEVGFIAGDSGSPSFMVFNGQLALVGVHYAISDIPPNPPQAPYPYWNWDSFVPYFADDLNAAMGPGYYLTIVPEPGTLLVIGAAGSAAAVRRLWRRRGVSMRRAR